MWFEGINCFSDSCLIQFCDVHYDVQGGYGSIGDTFDQVFKVDPTIQYEHVYPWVNKQTNKQRESYRGSHPYVAPFARFEYQINIMSLIRL